jgi:choice-of-anchor B domain-containing protein
MRSRTGLLVVAAVTVALGVMLTPGFAGQRAAETSASMKAEKSGFARAAKRGKADKDSGAARCKGGMAAGYPCKNIDLLSQVPLADLGLSFVNDIWGWTDSGKGKDDRKGKRGKKGKGKTDYALIGGTEGTVIVDISKPTRPDVIGILPAHTLDPQAPFWRDIKVYGHYMFVVSEQADHGLQVFDLKEIRKAKGDYTVFSETAHYAGFGHSHNLNINEDTGYAYAVGTSTCDGGLHMVDISDPESPTFAGCFAAHGYIHDTQCVVYKGPDREYKRHEICFNANAQQHHDPPPGSDPITNALSIVDVTDKSNPVVLSRTEYPNDGYSHQGWLVPGQKYFLHGDELDEVTHGINTTTRIWDVRDLDAPKMILEWQNDTTSIDHNMYTEGKYVYQSNYTSGLRILSTKKVSKPDLRELAYFDVYPENDNPSFEGGTWSNYPWFHQKDVVAVSSMDRGLFVLDTDLKDRKRHR